jgi:hypothetical protein
MKKLLLTDIAAMFLWAVLSCHEEETTRDQLPEWLNEKINELVPGHPLSFASLSFNCHSWSFIVQQIRNQQSEIRNYLVVPACEKQINQHLENKSPASATDKKYYMKINGLFQNFSL